MSILKAIILLIFLHLINTIQLGATKKGHKQLARNYQRDPKCSKSSGFCWRWCNNEGSSILSKKCYTGSSYGHYKKCEKDQDCTKALTCAHQCV